MRQNIELEKFKKHTRLEGQVLTNAIDLSVGGVLGAILVNYIL